MSRTPAVNCRSCGCGWHSASMVAGLAHVRGCPRCGGELHFHRAAEPIAEADRAGRFERVPPHLVLGIPRPNRRERDG